MGRPHYNLVVPMAGAGKRFRAAGYSTYKPFIPISNQPMVRYVTESFPASVDKFVICGEGLLEAAERRYLKEDLGCEIIDIDPHEEGPAFSIHQAASRLPLDESFFVSYCDIHWTWDFESLGDCLETDGAIFTHQGFHPHLIENSYSAFCLPAADDPRRLREIREKCPFTDRWMDEPLSIGLFYVKSGHAMTAAISRTIENEERVSGEFFPSLLFNHMAWEGRDVRLEPVDFFIHWGVPEQLRDFERWHAVINHDRDLRAVTGDGYPENVICMAGLGSRMKGASNQPKALTEVGSAPMFRFVADHFPSRGTCAITLKSIAEVMHHHGFTGEMVTFEEPTPSQFQTLFQAVGALRARQDFFLTSCDAYGLFDIAEFRRAADECAADAAVFSFVPSLTQSKMAAHHTHISVDGDRVKAIHIKSKSSEDDLGLAGFFWVRDGDIFQALEQIPPAPGEEMSVDHVFKHFVEAGLHVMRFDLDHYVHLGTAEELLEYRYWQERGHLFQTEPMPGAGPKSANATDVSNTDGRGRP